MTTVDADLRNGGLSLGVARLVAVEQEPVLMALLKF
jgi:hypothetical protein